MNKIDNQVRPQQLPEASFTNEKIAKATAIIGTVIAVASACFYFLSSSWISAAAFFPPALPIALCAIGLIVAASAIVYLCVQGNNLEIKENTKIREVEAPNDATPFTQTTANFIKNKEQIDNLVAINGVSIEEIEKRAKTNFLGKDESFKEVLKKDWDTTEKLKVTHLELAAHLKNIIDIAKKQEGDAREIAVLYRPNDLESNTIYASPQELEVVLEYTKGLQEDIFGHPEIPHDFDEAKKEVKTPRFWNEEFTITNKSVGMTLYVNSGVLSYIKEFGFYEGGGENNQYRVDPVKVMALLTGKSVEDLKQKIEDKKE